MTWIVVGLHVAVFVYAAVFVVAGYREWRGRWNHYEQIIGGQK